MTGFSGFPEGPVRMTPIPAAFFTELLPRIDHLGELKITLYALRALSLQEGPHRFLTLEEMSKDERLIEALSTGGKKGEQALADALERAVARGTLVAVHPDGVGGACYFLNSAKGRAAAAGLERGEWKPEGGRSAESFWVERPNIFTRYEQNIGPLTPLLADILRDAEKEYPAEWIEEAIRIAVESNARSWKYIAAVLERWKKEGRARKSPSGEERKRYIEGEYADFIEH
jgi:DNA replication protein